MTIINYMVYVICLVSWGVLSNCIGFRIQFNLFEKLILNIFGTSFIILLFASHMIK